MLRTIITWVVIIVVVLIVVNFIGANTSLF